MNRIIALLVFSISLELFATVQAADYHVAFWNVENLFDTVDDATVEGDEEYTPEKEKRWTEARLNQKLLNLSRLISKMNDGKGPDILGLAEIENRLVVEMLITKLKPLGRHYKIVHKDSPSGRGIDCALFYDSDKFDLQSSAFHHVPAEYPSRDIVEAELKDKGGDKLTVFVNHWPSRRNPESDRLAAAKVLRERLDTIFTKTPSADVIIIGDFNDYPDNDSLLKILKASENPSDAKDGALLNTMWPMHRKAEKGTYVYNDKWEIIDHVIVSPGLLDKQGFSWKAGSTDSLMLMDDQLYHPKAPAIPRPSRSYSGNSFHKAGYSDHLPVEAILTH